MKPSLVKDETSIYFFTNYPKNYITFYVYVIGCRQQKG
jgi:hypothetical protein